MAGKWAEDDSKKLAAEQALAASFPVNPVLRQHLQAFWQQQSQEMAVVSDFKNHNLPLARIKKIMKSDEDVRMISSEAPALFAKACEMFILELTLRSWVHSEENKRRTLQRSDIATAVQRTDILDFLVDIMPAVDQPGAGEADGGAAEGAEDEEEEG